MRALELLMKRTETAEGERVFQVESANMHSDDVVDDTLVTSSPCTQHYTHTYTDRQMNCIYRVCVCTLCNIAGAGTYFRVIKVRTNNGKEALLNLCRRANSIVLVQG